VSAGSTMVDEARCCEFLFEKGIDAPFCVVYGCAMPTFFVLETVEVDMVEKRSLVATLEASDRESSG
jgi:hypothetical protein